MKVLVLGSGGREHALARALLDSPQVTTLVCAPGNGGTASLDRCENVAVAAEDIEGVARLARDRAADLVVVGPELPLAAGIVDRLQGEGILAFGPTQAGARIEASKAWAKDLMAAANVPTAAAVAFRDAARARDYIRERGAPIVVKADGLAAGKGVTVATTVAEAEAAITTLLARGDTTAIVEDFMAGREVSVLALTDGNAIVPLLPAQDHKRIGEGDTGPNTGGMGAYAPVPWVGPELMARIEAEILQPTLGALQQRGIDYRGVLYAGLMVTPAGDPKVVEFNCRFGDPEAQTILPLLETPLADLLLACCQQRLRELLPLRWHQARAVCVVAAAAGYPGAYPKGLPISGLDRAAATGAYLFHAGTQQAGDGLKTSGGRVLAATALGPDFAAAADMAYAAMAQVRFEGIYYRRDIGARVRGS